VESLGHFVVFKLAHRDLAVSLHDRQLDVLGSGLHHLEQTLDGQLDGLCPVEVLLPVLLKELSDGL
jgi:hypothetical protein